MSISSEITRIQQAKSDLATSIENKGVTVPAATTIDGYAALVDQIQQGGGTLPYDAEIEYIECTGTQYINLGHCQTDRNMEIRMRMQWTGSTADQFETFFGYINGSNSTPRNGLHKYQGKWMFGTNTTQKTDVSVDNNINAFFITGNTSESKDFLYKSSTKIGTASTTSTGLSGNTIPYYIGCRNRNGSIDNYASVRIMYFHLMEFTSTTHTRISYEINLIPVRVGQVGYLYDKISGTLLGNSGTGSFILGNDVT